MRDKRRFFSIIVISSTMISGLIFSIKVYAETKDVQPTPVKNQLLEEKMVGKKIAHGNITIDFKDADIRTVLRVLAEKSGVNIVAGKDVTGDITIRLTNVRWERALDIICKNYGYAFEREENIIRVTTVEGLKQEELTTEVFSLNYAKAGEVAEAITEMLTERGRDKIKYDERTNVLIVTDIPTNLYKVRQVVEKLDKKTPQVLIEARIIETTLTDDEKLGIDWNLKLAAVGASRPTTLPFTVGGSLSYLGLDVQDWNKFMPRPEGQVSTTYTGEGIAVTDTTSEFPLGITGLDISQAFDSPFPVMDASAFTFGTLDFSKFSMVMEYLKSRRDTNVLSNPRIATLNNQEASIHVGTILPIPVREYNEERDEYTILTYTEKKIGIKLTVTPHVNVQSDIVVELFPEISSLVGWEVWDAARGLKGPIYSTREAQTQVMVRDRETIMIGGLINEETTNYEKKVPLLGDIPGLGKWLFTKTESDVDRTEIIIFLTVHLIGTKSADSSTVSPSVFVPLPVEEKK